MGNHLNRGRAPKPGRNPRPAEVRQLRLEMEMSQAEAGALLYVDEGTWQKWELGQRRMHAAMWEYVNLLWGFRAVEKAREVWLTHGNVFSVPDVGDKPDRVIAKQGNER